MSRGRLFPCHPRTRLAAAASPAVRTETAAEQEQEEEEEAACPSLPQASRCCYLPPSLSTSASACLPAILPAPLLPADSPVLVCVVLCAIDRIRLRRGPASASAASAAAARDRAGAARPPRLLHRRGVRGHRSGSLPASSALRYPNPSPCRRESQRPQRGPGGAGGRVGAAGVQRVREAGPARVLLHHGAHGAGQGHAGAVRHAHG